MENTDIINDTQFTELPIIPLRGLVVFPKMSLHFDVGRKKSIAALKKAMENEQKFFSYAKRMHLSTSRRLMICTIRV